MSVWVPHHVNVRRARLVMPVVRETLAGGRVSEESQVEEGSVRAVANRSPPLRGTVRAAVCGAPLSPLNPLTPRT